MSEPIYTQPQIEEAWKEYNAKTVMRILKGGEWKTYDLGSAANGTPGNIGSMNGATRSEIVKLRTVMSFPKYLNKHYG